MDYRKKLQAAADLEKMAPKSVLARTIAKGAALDARDQGATLAEFSESVAEAGASELVPVECWGLFASVYGASALVPQTGWEWAA